MKKKHINLPLIALLAVAGCATTKLNYASPEGPRYVGRAAASAVVRADRLRVVSFNIEYALRVDSAVVVLKSDSALRAADVILLQEMDEAGTRRVADALSMSYVYYPATLHPHTGRDMGNAVLSRWPIIEDTKVLLPHLGRIRGTQRAATGATIRVGETMVRVYSAHLGTIADVGAEGRRDQLRAILADAERYPRVIIGGDMNNGSVGNVARAAGYAWPTEHGPHTIHGLSWDHIFLKGFDNRDRGQVGTVVNNHHASDHRPIWTTAVLP